MAESDIIMTQEAGPTDSSDEESVGFYDDKDEDIRNFREYWDEMRPTVGDWSKATEFSKESNAEQLAEEMWSTLRQLSGYMRDIELAAKSRRLKRINNMTGDWINFCKGEEKFLNSLEFGKKAMTSLVKALGMGPVAVNPSQKTTMQAPELYLRISSYSDFAKDKSIPARIKELGICLRELVGRFSRICDSEGVHHELPVTTQSDALPFRGLPPIMKRTSTYQIPPQQSEVRAEPESSNIIHDFGDFIKPEEPIIEEVVRTPTEFVDAYCKRDRTTAVYQDVGVVKSSFGQEYVMICRVRNIGGEGKAKKKITARQCAAANMIKSMLWKQKRGKLQPDARQLSEQERGLAIRVISEYLDFEKDLEKISQEEYHRAPIYTPVLNTLGHQVRCKALGFNAVGYGRSKELARRMAAKLILDLHKELKEQKKKDLKAKLLASKPSFIRPAPSATISTESRE